MSRGLVLGKFLPPHAGHLHLVHVGRALVDELVVVVGSLDREPIPGALRHRWMRELAPDARVLHLHEDLPQSPEEHPRFWQLWRTALKRLVPEPIDHVFASETYGTRLAAELDATFIPVDPARDALGVSGTAVRADPFSNWHLLPPPVRAYACQRVAVYGPESCGKTTLARALAEQFHTVWVPEYARIGLEHGAPLSLASLRQFMRAQAASEDALARQANRRLICDTEPSVTPLWAELLLGESLEAPPPRHYDLTLLLRPDIPFEADAVRFAPGQREAFFDRCRAALERAGRRFVILEGDDFDERLRTAVRAIENLAPPSLDEPRPKP